MQRREEYREERRFENMERRSEDHQDHLDYVRENIVTFRPARSTKILVSPGQGAGWSTWAPRSASDAFLAWMITYEPMIRGLERGDRREHLEDILKDFHREAHNRHGVERIVCARVGDLVVQEVSYPFEVKETDGAERVVDVSHRRNISI